jgi:hypothetical protein
MVYTPSGGPQDYASPRDICVARTGAVPTDPFYGWGSTYLDYDMEQAAAALRMAHDHVMRPPREPESAQHLSAFQSRRVGAAMADAIAQVTAP